MLLKEYTTNKRAQGFLDALCNQYAESMSLYAEDIKSQAHERITIQINKGREVKDEKHLLNLVRLIALNSAKDLVLKNYNRHEKPEDPLLLPEPTESVEMNYETADLFNRLDGSIRKNFFNKLNVIIAYEHCILAGRTIEEVGKQFQINISTIKTNMRMVRSFANQQILKLNQYGT